MRKRSAIHIEGAGWIDTALAAIVTMLSLSMTLALVVLVVNIADVPVFHRVIYAFILLSLLFCCFSYELSRYGLARRGQRRAHVAESELEHLLAPSAPSIAVLIPSYREEPRVIAMTMLSAAVARYGNRRIVLLVDDPATDLPSLRSSRAAAQTVIESVRTIMRPLRAAAQTWQASRSLADLNLDVHREQVCALYQLAANWLDEQAADFRNATTPAFRHVDCFFADQVLGDLAELYRDKARQLVQQGADERELDVHYAILRDLFCSDITVFERKAYANLSHAPNKAMNLNAYIGLMGKRFRITRRGKVVRLLECGDGWADLAVARPDLVLTLDADSVILHDYMLRLTHALQENPQAAVAQTPYLTFPDSTSVVERVAGATTDIQYLAHQGSTFFNASYWVGANALIRYKALQDIACDQTEGAQTVRVFIQDRTVIEDTGSTIDLLGAGWQVHNHLTPLAYSATPADFGALAIQRKRWSNGGLIIFPTLLKHYLKTPGRLRRLPELVVRTNYLLSPLLGNIAVFVLMVWSPSDSRTLLMWTPLAIAPYFCLYASDLHRLGYRLSDLFRVCALNLMLLPVSFAGILASLRQMVTGRKGSFTRTPKVADRTFIPPYSFLFNGMMLLLMAFYVIQGVVSEKYVGTIVPAINVILYAYGLHSFIGFRNGFADLALAIRHAMPAAMFPAAAGARAVSLRTVARSGPSSAAVRVSAPLRRIAAAIAFFAVLLGPALSVPSHSSGDPRHLMIDDRQAAWLATQGHPQGTATPSPNTASLSPGSD